MWINNVAVHTDVLLNTFEILKERQMNHKSIVTLSSWFNQREHLD